ncbi:MAG TPA: ABC transporter permease [Pirellulales bacterium]|jgi:ABC-type transport system involved in multi-copper enzyme maturation permease subunit
MVLEKPIQPYSEWLPQALLHYGEAAFFVVLAALVVSYLVAAFRYGPMPAGDRVYRMLVGSANDLIRISPRRIWALTRLAIQESVRRKVWVALVAFAVILMFAGWFLDPASRDPGPLYLTFVMSWTTYLVVLMALFISAFSLPADIKNKTITTVVTKPVRTAEIVLGRMLGFTVVGTALLAVMGVASYVFVVRSLAHTHEIRPEDITESSLDPANPKPGKVGVTRTAQNHFHDVILKEDGTLVTDFSHGHEHQVFVKKNADGKNEYTVGPHQGMLTARVPIIGELVFLDRDGKPSKGGGQGKTGSGGINVGKEWDYHGFIEGGSQSAAVWNFDHISESTFQKNKAGEDVLPLRMTIRVFRTYKGNIEKGISGKLFFRNPDTKLESEPIIFIAKEFSIDSRDIKRRITRAGAADNDPKLDLLNDLVSKGKLQIVLQCLEPGQYYGVAQDDLYIRAGDESFELNFCKGYAGIWCQMVLVIGLGVMFSTFLSGAVAMLATLGCIVLGYFAADVGDLFKSVITGDRKMVPGGGPVESFVRLITQKSITVPYDDSSSVEVMYWIDKMLMRVLKSWTDVLPDFSTFSNVNFVASGFNVPPDLLLQQATQMVGYLVAMFLAGFLFLRMREVAR